MDNNIARADKAKKEKIQKLLTHHKGKIPVVVSYEEVLKEPMK